MCLVLVFDFLLRLVRASESPMSQNFELAAGMHELMLLQSKRVYEVCADAINLNLCHEDICTSLCRKEQGGEIDGAFLQALFLVSFSRRYST